MQSDALLERLLALHPKRIDLVLDRVWRLLQALDNPERRLPPVVHIAGTNGKGSTLVFLRALAEAEGLKVQVYTSPHLCQFRERVRLPDGLIDELYLADCLARAEQANAGQAITFFEITTCAAFLAFAETPADLLLLETGLGGRLDATNVVAAPALTLLTPVSMDHEAFLGDNLTAIAREKAGIMKPKVPALSAPQAAPVWQEFAQRAQALDAPLAVASPYKGAMTDWSLSGEHQRVNAGLALAAARQLGWRVAADGIAANAANAPASNVLAADILAEARWPGRWQVLEEGALHAWLPPETSLILDGGHNPAAGQALAQQLRTATQGPIHLILGMMRQKDVAGYLAPLLTQPVRLTCIEIPDQPQSLAAQSLQETALGLGHAASSAASLEAALAMTQRGERVVVAGSLYLVGQALLRHGLTLD